MIHWLGDSLTNSINSSFRAGTHMKTDKNVHRSTVRMERWQTLAVFKTIMCLYNMTEFTSQINCIRELRLLIVYLRQSQKELDS
jgi:hypothetical protein